MTSPRARRHPAQPPLLATVTQLPRLSLADQARDIRDTLAAVGIHSSPEQCLVLAEHGLVGLGLWTPSRDLRDIDQAVRRTYALEAAARQALHPTTPDQAHQEGPR